MSLEVQVQSLAAAFLYGLAVSFGYGWINRLVYRCRRGLLGYLIEIVLASLISAGLFFSLQAINGGYTNVYMLMTFCLGVMVYEFCFARLYLGQVGRQMRLVRWLFFPFRFIFRSINAILRKIRKVMGLGQANKKIQKE